MVMLTIAMSFEGEPMLLGTALWFCFRQLLSVGFRRKRVQKMHDAGWSAVAPPLLLPNLLLDCPATIV